MLFLSKSFLLEGKYGTLPTTTFFFLAGEVLSRSGSPHHAVNNAKIRVVFYSVGFEGFIEPSDEIVSPLLSQKSC